MRGCLWRFSCETAKLAGDLSFECERSRWETGGGIKGGDGGAFPVVYTTNNGFSAARAITGAKTGVTGTIIGVTGRDRNIPIIFGKEIGIEGVIVKESRVILADILAI